MDGINHEIAGIINEQMDALSEIIVSRQYEIQPEIWERYGEKGRKLSLRDSNYHFKYLTEALTENDPTIFTNYVIWLKQLFESLKFPPEALTVMLDCTADALREKLDPEMSSVTDNLINEARVGLQSECLQISSYITHDVPLYDLARQYLDALLSGDRRLASKMILDAVEGGVHVRDIYIYVFQRSQYEIGRLWYLNQVSVAQEHYCSAATQLIMSQLYPYIFSTDKKGLRFMAACVGGELHELGIRMVADFFEMDGWDTYYMGANTPTASIIEALDSHSPHVIGISASMPTHIGILKELITTVRNHDSQRHVKIMVGGYALQSSPELWVKLGADGYARDAEQAVAFANNLVSTKAV